MTCTQLLKPPLISSCQLYGSLYVCLPWRSINCVLDSHKIPNGYQGKHSPYFIDCQVQRSFQFPKLQRAVHKYRNKNLGPAQARLQKNFWQLGKSQHFSRTCETVLDIQKSSPLPLHWHIPMVAYQSPGLSPGSYSLYSQVGVIPFKTPHQHPGPSQIPDFPSSRQPFILAISIFSAISPALALAKSCLILFIPSLDSPRCLWIFSLTCSKKKKKKQLSPPRRWSSHLGGFFIVPSQIHIPTRIIITPKSEKHTSFLTYGVIFRSSNHLVIFQRTAAQSPMPHQPITPAPKNPIPSHLHTYI